MLIVPDPVALFWRLLPAAARAAGFATLMPTLGVGTGRARAVIALVLTLLLLPPGEDGAGAPADQAGWLPVVAAGGFGLLFGFALRVAVMAVDLASQCIEQALGLPLAFDTEERAAGTPLGRLYQMTALAVFFAAGGQRVLVAGLLDSAAAGRALGGGAGGLVEAATLMVGQAWWFGVEIAGPMLLALVTTGFAAGMIARVLPQFAGSAAGAPGPILTGLVLVFLSVAALGSSLGTGCVAFLTEAVRQLSAG